MAKLIGKRYALALFDAGQELEKVDDFKEELNYIIEILNKESELVSILEHPKISKKDKKELIVSVFGEDISEEIKNFLYIIIDKGRERNIFDINKEYKTLYNENKNLVEAVAVTAVPMNKDSQDKLSVVLSEKLGKTVKIDNEVDKSILGGVLLKMENKVIDGTIKGRLESMERTIKGAKV